MANTEPAVAPQSTAQQQNGTPPPLPNIEFKNRLNESILSYPTDLKNKSNKQSYIRFKSYDYSLLQKSSDVFNLSAIGQAAAGGLEQVVKFATSTAAASLSYASDIIDLYVPPGINVSYGANWGEASLGPLGSQRTGNGNENGILQLFGNLLGGSIETLTSTSLDKLTEKLNTIPGFNATGQDILGLTTGLVFNENKFSTFNSMSFRTFNYSFLFVARSEKEKDTINQIINTFKIAMHPAGLTIGASGTGPNDTNFNPVARPPVLKYPKLWTIEYKIGDQNNRYLPKTKFCAIQNLSINYTPNSAFTTLSDGAIPAIQMDIDFKELTTLTADQIIDGSILNGTGKDGIKFFENTGVETGKDLNYLPKAGGTF